MIVTILHPRRARLILLLLFALVEALFHLNGGSFNAAPLECFWQYLDPEQLKTALFQSVYYLHSQPPLFNFFLGLVLAAGAGYSNAIFHFCFLIAGAALLLCLFSLIELLSGSVALALLGSAAFLLTPSFILYEHFLFYSLFEALLVVLICLGSGRFIIHNDRRSFALAAWAIALLSLTRSLIHPLIALLFIGLLPFLKRGAPNGTVRVAALPLLMVVFFLAKNILLFGEASFSSWLGLNLSNNLEYFVSPSLRAEIRTQKRYQLLFSLPPFSPLPIYQAHGIGVVPPPGRLRHVAVLSNFEKREINRSAPASEMCEVNFNHYSYIAFSRQYFAEATDFFMHHPEVLVRRFIAGWSFYFWPSSRYLRLEENRSHIESWERWVNRFIFLKRSLPGMAIDEKPNAIYLSLLLGLPLIYFASVAELLFGVVAFEKRMTLLLILVIITYVSVVGNLIEVPENNRFRFSIDPLFYALACYLVARLCRRLRGHTR